MSDPFCFPTQPIQRVVAPSREEFAARFKTPRVPVIVTGALSHWPALGTWSAAYLRDKLADKVVGVYLSEDGIFPGSRPDPFDRADPAADGRTAEEMRFGSFLDHVVGPRSRHYYLYHVSLPAELAADIEVPEFVAAGDERVWVRTNFWVSGAGGVTPLHFDSSDNLLAQVVSPKRVLLMPPAAYDRVYPFSCDHLYARQSQILDLEQPDLERFPRLRDVTGLEGVLQPGEMLFIPGCWWHWVKTIDFSVSLNFFASNLDAMQATYKEWSDVVRRYRASLADDIPDLMRSYLLRATV